MAWTAICRSPQLLDQRRQRGLILAIDGDEDGCYRHRSAQPLSQQAPQGPRYYLHCQPVDGDVPDVIAYLVAACFAAIRLWLRGRITSASPADPTVRAISSVFEGLQLCTLAIAMR
jgi:hypothetical protein